MTDDVTTDTPDLPANDLIMAKDMADTLNTHYPGHLWAVNVDGKQGMADIRNLALSGDWGHELLRERVQEAGGTRGRRDTRTLQTAPRQRR